MMTEAQYTSVIAALWFLLTGILGWVGLRIFGKLDKLSEQMSSINVGLQKQISDGDNILHGRINSLDRRVSRVEAKCHITVHESAE